MTDKHAHLREAMIQIASKLIESDGLPAVQARRIAKEANCSVGTLYNVFGNLDRVVIDANMVTLDQLRETLEAALAELPQRDGEAVLMKLALAYLDFAQRHRSAWRAIFEHRLTAEETGPESYREKQAELFAIVETALEPAFGSSDDIRCASRALFGAVHGIVSLALDEKLGTYDETETRRQVVLVVKAIARGLKLDHQDSGPDTPSA
jgi:AcrR family transcriptional regulator